MPCKVLGSAKLKPRFPCTTGTSEKLKMKEWYFSRTIVLAVLQGISGVMIAILSSDPTLTGAGGFMVAKSFIDILLRNLTNTEIK